MLSHVDPLLLIFGCARIGVWATIAIVGYRWRRILPLAYGAAAALTSIVFAITNAHSYVPGVLTDISTFIALPISVLILVSVLSTEGTVPTTKPRGWQL